MKYKSLFLGLVLCGCTGINHQQGNKPEVEKLNTIRIGADSKEDVRQKLGTPSFSSVFNNKTWYYINKRTNQVAFWKPDVMEQNVIAITFNPSGVVQKVAGYDKNTGRDIDPSGRKTKTAGKQVSFFEQLLGNVGRFNQQGQ